MFYIRLWRQIQRNCAHSSLPRTKCKLVFFKRREMWDWWIDDILVGFQALSFKDFPGELVVKNPQEKQEIQVWSQEVIILDCFWLWVLDNSRRRSSLMISLVRILELPRWLSGQESAWQCRRHKRPRFDPWVGRFPGGGNGNPLQYSCLENPMGRNLAGYSPCDPGGVTKSQTWLSTHILVKFFTVRRWRPQGQASHPCLNRDRGQGADPWLRNASCYASLTFFKEGMFFS